MLGDNIHERQFFKVWLHLWPLGFARSCSCEVCNLVLSLRKYSLKQDVGGFVGRVLRDQSSLESLLQDALPQSSCSEQAVFDLLFGSVDE